MPLSLIRGPPGTLSRSVGQEHSLDSARPEPLVDNRRVRGCRRSRPRRHQPTRSGYASRHPSQLQGQRQPSPVDGMPMGVPCT